MTDAEINQAIAESVGTNDRWVIMKHGLYYRPQAHGYTNKVSEAWIVSEEEADKETYPHDDPVTKHRAPQLDYTNDLNAMHEAEKTLTVDEAVRYRLWLSANSGKAHTKYLSAEAAMCHATARERSEQFLRTKGLWK